MFITGNIKVEENAQTGLKRLLEDVIYETSDGRTIIVPAGYESDYASTPRCVSWLLPKDSSYRNAAVIHDFLITDTLIKDKAIESNRVDEIFMEAASELGIPKARQLLLWCGVRIGAIGNKLRRKGSLRTFPKVLLISILAFPFIGLPSLVVQIFLWIIALVTLVLPKGERVNAQTQ